MKLMKLRKYTIVLLFGFLAAAAGHANDLPSCVWMEVSQEEVGADSHRLPFHYEQINLLSIQQGFQQNHLYFQSVFFPENGFDSWLRMGEDLMFSFLQDIRFLLGIQLYPFHSFW